MKYFQSFDDLKLAYHDQGVGPPVLCLSGLTRNSTDFDYIAALLPNYRVIRMDYRGRGASAWSDDPDSYSWDNEAQDALDLLDHLGIEKTALLGTSRGGMIAMYLAATAKHRLTGVCLNDIGPDLDQTGLERIKNYVGVQPAQKTMQELAAVLKANSPDFKNVPAERWLAEAGKRAVKTPDGLALAYDPNLRKRLDKDLVVTPPDLWPMFDALNGLPLALIRGTNSDIVSAETVQEMRRRRPDMTYANIPDRGHVPYLDEPEAVTIINNWLEACQ